MRAMVLRACGGGVELARNALVALEQGSAHAKYLERVTGIEPAFSAWEAG
jgi:hypothetical protein